MAQFELCFSFVLPNEDFDPPQYKEVPDPTSGDPEAKAIAGINSHYWAADYAQIASLPQDSRAASVANFYRVNFWNKWLEQLTSNRLAAMTLDAGVNQGAGWAVRFLQGATGATVDGHWGPSTIALANAAELDDAVNQFIVLRKARYNQVGGPSLPQWLERAAKIPSFT
jgi:lysozyme family protein